MKLFMKRRFRNSIQITFERGIFLYLALLLLLIPLRLFIALIISAVIHELFHIIALKLMDKEIYSVKICLRGAMINTQCMNEKEELLCALAGPLSGILLMLFVRWIPVIALAGFVQALYNLLPLYPTDGGRILKCGMLLILPIKLADKIIYWTEVVTLSVITAACVYGSVYLRLGIIPMMMSAVLVLKSAKRK